MVVDEMTTQTELEKRLQELEAKRTKARAKIMAWSGDRFFLRQADEQFNHKNADQYRQLALSAIKLAAARGELIEWLESGATSGDAEIRRRIEEASR
jgi:hypothetical protein